MIINHLQVNGIMKKLWLCLLFFLAACGQVECDDACLLDMRSCTEITSDTIKDTCYAELAIEQDDQTLCSNITSIQTSDYCNTQFIKLQNPDMCETLNTDYWTYNCYSHFAVNDSSLCDFVKEPGQCYLDHAIEQNSSAMCYDSNDVDYCLYQIATATLNLDLCKELESVNKYTCQIKIAVALNDTSICDNLGGTWSEHCMERIA